MNPADQPRQDEDPRASGAEHPEPRPHPWSLRIGSVAGIPIRIHFTFWLLLVWMGWTAHQSGKPVASQVVLIVCLFACIVLHELGHALTAKSFGIRTRDITLYPIGGISSLQSMGKPRQELWISLAGPAVNIAIAVVLGVVLAVSGQAITLQALTSGKLGLLQLLFLGNVFLVLFNVVPAFPMDGGRILRAALALRLGVDRATRIAATIGQGLAILMGLAGLLMDPPQIMLMFIAMFVFLGASAEAEMQRSLASTSGRRMRDAMITRFETVSHGDTLASVVELLVRTNQEDFPVVHGERVLGLLTRRQLLSGLASQGKEALVSEFMSREVPRVAPGDDLTLALGLLRGKSTGPLLVFEGDRLVGVITLDNLLEFMSLARAGGLPSAPQSS